MSSSRFLVIIAFFVLAVVASAHDVEKRDVISDITSGAVSIFSDVTSGAVSVATEGASGAVGVFETVTSFGGSAFTIVTSAGGEGFTLATSGFGKVTTFGGSVFTVATGAVGSAATGGSTSNAASAFAVQPWSAYGPTVLSMMTVVLGMLIGAWATF